MKAFKGCTNVDCKAYKKIHYKNEDQFCLKCGKPLSYVCAECWKIMEDSKDRLCISCQAEKEQKRAQTVDKVKNGGGKAVAVIGGVACAIVTIGRDADKIAGGAKKVASAGVKVVKLIKK